jgi:hypothetical protein
MCLFTSALRASVNVSHIPSLPQNNLYLLCLISHSEVDEWTGDKCYKVPKLRNEPNHEKEHLKISKYTKFEDVYMNTLRITSFRKSRYFTMKCIVICVFGTRVPKTIF